MDKAIIAAVSKEPSKRDAAAEQRIRAAACCDRRGARCAAKGVCQRISRLRGVVEPAAADRKGGSGAAVRRRGAGVVLRRRRQGELRLRADARQASTGNPSRSAATRWREGRGVPARARCRHGGGPGCARRHQEQARAVRSWRCERALRRATRSRRSADQGQEAASRRALRAAHRAAVPSAGDRKAAALRAAGQKQPHGRHGAYRDAAWLIKRQAVSVLPSVASLKALRQFGRKDQAPKPMVGFGDPVFNADAAAATTARRATRRLPEASPRAPIPTSGKAQASTAQARRRRCRSCPTPRTN